MNKIFKKVQTIVSMIHIKINNYKLLFLFRKHIKNGSYFFDGHKLTKKMGGHYYIKYITTILFFHL